ncbi:hypothetical protein RDI58_015995 [Solanum bulbocastanum]|uniref:F-box/LRR-repeat protein 15/At3g58940/PEG3-like LRR domain-containing protein n=2 Tax=Solanum TaxID=4107 RepID=A0AAN8TI10_SOLBU
MNNLIRCPQVLCSNSSLVELNCKYCKLSENCVLNWPSLESLTLTNLLLGDENIKQISSGCPQLESLELSEFCGLHHLHITSPKCTRLLLSEHRHPMND